MSCHAKVRAYWVEMFSYYPRESAIVMQRDLEIGVAAQRAFLFVTDPLRFFSRDVHRSHLCTYWALNSYRRAQEPRSAQVFMTSLLMAHCAYLVYRHLDATARFPLLRQQPVFVH